MQRREGCDLAASAQDLGGHDDRKRARSRNHHVATRKGALCLDKRLRATRIHHSGNGPTRERDGDLAHAACEDHRIGAEDLGPLVCGHMDVAWPKHGEG